VHEEAVLGANKFAEKYNRRKWNLRIEVSLIPAWKWRLEKRVDFA